MRDYVKSREGIKRLVGGVVVRLSMTRMIWTNESLLLVGDSSKQTRTQSWIRQGREDRMFDQVKIVEKDIKKARKEQC
jgi:hypothetical protein